MRTVPARFAALLLLLSALGCGDGSDRSRAKATPAPARTASSDTASSGTSDRPLLVIPVAPPGPEDRIRFYLDLLVRGDLDEVTWAREQLVAAGRAATGPLVDLLRKNLRKNMVLAESILFLWAERVSAPEAVPVMIEACRSTDGRVRMLAARALGNSGSRAAVAPLLDLTRDPHHRVSTEAILALGRLGLEEGGRGLVGRFPDRIDASVHPLAIRMAGRLLPEAAAVSFLKARLESEDPGDLLAAARALLARGHREGLDVVWSRYKTDLPQGLRYAALEVLAEGGDPRALPLALDWSRSPSAGRRSASVGLLSFYDAPPAREALRRLSRSSVEAIRRDALITLVKAGDKKARIAMLRLLHSARAADRKVAALAAGAWKDPVLLPDIIGALEVEEDPRVGLFLARALSLIGDPRGALPVVRLLLTETHPDPAEAVTAMNCSLCLRAFPSIPGEAVRLLLAGTRSERPSIRLQCLHPLARFGRGDEVRQVLLRALRDPSVHVRREAIRAWLKYPLSDAASLAEVYREESDDDLARDISRVAREIVHRWPR